MYEKEIEDILFRFPELIEDGLKPMDRQVPLYGKRADLLFQDGSGRKLIVELKGKLKVQIDIEYKNKLTGEVYKTNRSYQVQYNPIASSTPIPIPIECDWD